MRRVKKLKVFQIYPNFKFCHDFMLGKTFPSNFLPKNYSLPFLWMGAYTVFLLFFAPLDGTNHPEVCTRNDLLDKII